MPKTIDRVTELRTQIADIERSLTALDNPSPTVNGVPVEYSEPMPLYERLKSEIANEDTRAEALRVKEKLREELPRLKAELAKLEAERKRQQHLDEYNSLMNKINPLIDEVNAKGDELEALISKLAELDSRAAVVYSHAFGGGGYTWMSYLGNFRRFLPRFERDGGKPGYALRSRVQ
ncbi:MAG: hypothetical protein ACKO7W_09045 [Elainella sp.]